MKEPRFDFPFQWNTPLLIFEDPVHNEVVIVSHARRFSSNSSGKNELDERRKLLIYLQQHYPRRQMREHEIYGKNTTEKWKKLEKEYRNRLKKNNCLLLQGHPKYLSHTSIRVLHTKENFLMLHHVSPEQLRHLWEHPEKKEWVKEVLLESIRLNWDDDNKLFSLKMSLSHRIQWQEHWLDILKDEWLSMKRMKDIRKQLQLPPPNNWNELMGEESPLEPLHIGGLDFDSHL